MSTKRGKQPLIRCQSESLISHQADSHSDVTSQTVTHISSVRQSLIFHQADRHSYVTSQTSLTHISPHRQPLISRQSEKHTANRMSTERETDSHSYVVNHSLISRQADSHSDVTSQTDSDSIIYLNKQTAIHISPVREA